MLLASVRASADTYDWKTWGAVSDTLAVAKSNARLTLSSPFIQPGSENIYVDGRPLSSQQYEINYQRGLIRINTPIGDNSVVIASYVRQPFILESVYSLREIQFTDGEEVVPQRTPEIRPTQQAFNPMGNLVFGGVKSISLAFGSSQNATLDQNLRATVEGNLTSTIRVKALLSDNNLPIQPEGNTQELEYLDKVVVELSGPNAHATMGDFALSNDVSRFSAFQRELKGVSGKVLTKQGSVGAAAGSSKGVFRTVTFRGTEQLQGPYELLTLGRVVGEVIIAGTERVYFDGDLLRRGNNLDYTMDYDRGTITFTPRRRVTADTEIAVDFQATQDAYDRTSLFGGIDSAKLFGGLMLHAMAVRERDDTGRPKSVSFDEGDRAILEGAGDDANLAIAGGATFVGAGNGDYVLVPADTVGGVPEHFEFNDTSGTHQVIFTDVNVGQGDYVLEQITTTGVPVYRFVGAGAGNFLVGKRLPLPQSHSVIGTRIDRTGGEHFEFDLQYNVSDFDQNILSSLDNEDNIGDAGELKLGIKRVPVRIGHVGVSGSISTIEDTYRSLDRTRTWYFYRDWNLERDALVGREVLQEITSSFLRDDLLRLDYGFGSIQRENFEGTKHEGRFNLSKVIDRTLNARVFQTNLDGKNGGDEKRDRTHATVKGSYGFWRIIPEAQYSSEEFLVTSPTLPDSGIAYDSYLLRLSRRQPKKFSYTLQAEERNTDQLADTTNGWLHTRTDRTYSMSLLSRGWSALQGEVQYSHRVQENKLVGGNQTSDLARLKGLVRIARAGIRSNFDYEISQNQFRTQEKSVVFVGEGQGDYNELGEPVGKGRGAYTIVFLNTLQTTPTNAVDFNMTLSWRLTNQPRQTDLSGGIVAWILSNVSLEQSLNLREETTFDDAYKVYLFFPSALQRDESTLFGITQLRQDWSLLNAYPKVSLLFRYQRDDEEENRFNSVNEERFFQQHAIQVNRSISRVVSANAEVRREVRRRGGKGLPSGTGSTYDVNGIAVVGGWGLRFSAGSSLDGDIEFRQQKDSESGADERAFAIKPRFVLRLTKALNVFGRYEVTRFTGVSAGDIRPFFFSDEGTSQRWSLTPNLKISRMISVLATYDGRSESTFSGARITEHDFKVETRAFF